MLKELSFGTANNHKEGLAKMIEYYNDATKSEKGHGFLTV